MISNLHHRVLRVILHLEHLPLQQETAVYTRNWGVPKITFLHLSFFLSLAVSRAKSLPHRLHAPLFTSICIAPYRALQ